MTRAVFIDVACFTDSRREDRLLDEIAAEFLPLPVVPAAVDWPHLDPALRVEATASWLVTGPEAPCCCEPGLAGVFAGCIAVGGGGLTHGRPRPSLAMGPLARAAAHNGWRCAPDLASALSAIRAATVASHVLTDFAAVAAFARRLRARGRQVVFTNGVFDLFHLGHLRLLEAARHLGDALVVGVNGDDSAARLKGRARPVLPQFARAAIVAACRPVDLVAIFDEDTPVELLRAVRPDVLVKGGEYRLSQVVGRSLVEGWGGTVATVPHVEGVSTSGLVARIRDARAGASKTRAAAARGRGRGR
ncbi:MAG: adenylyltransferase/cytidyltransferase family protein [Spirochaetes bacterium]|nr:adenylyltransferase/cytidyltransferase family protein [Spirochaetota bacterium]